jgi:hypothetical protein
MQRAHSLTYKYGASTPQKTGGQAIGRTTAYPVPAGLGAASLFCSIPEENHAAAKAAFLQKLELQADMVGEGLFSTSYHDRREE